MTLQPVPAATVFPNSAAGEVSPHLAHSTPFTAPAAYQIPIEAPVIAEAQLPQTGNSARAIVHRESKTLRGLCCSIHGCKKVAQGRTHLCIGHGGGRRCMREGCQRGARDREFCASHGGGRRCTTEGCSKAAVGSTKLCTGHGGGRRCAFPSGCPKSAQSATQFCVRHGGGRKCSTEGCEKVARGKTPHCASHGGGARCLGVGGIPCRKLAVGGSGFCNSHQPPGAGPQNSVQLRPPQAFLPVHLPGSGNQDVVASMEYQGFVNNSSGDNLSTSTFRSDFGDDFIGGTSSINSSSRDSIGNLNSSYSSIGHGHESSAFAGSSQSRSIPPPKPPPPPLGYKPGMRTNGFDTQQPHKPSETT